MRIIPALALALAFSASSGVAQSTFLERVLRGAAAAQDPVAYYLETYGGAEAGHPAVDAPANPLRLYSGTVDGSTLYGTSQDLGSLTLTDLSIGSRSVSGLTQDIGDLSVTSWSDGSSSLTQRFGDLAVTTGDDGTSYVSQRFGDLTIMSGSDGSSGMAQRIGSMEFTTITRPPTYYWRPYRPR